MCHNKDITSMLYKVTTKRKDRAREDVFLLLYHRKQTPIALHWYDSVHTFNTSEHIRVFMVSAEKK